MSEKLKSSWELALERMANKGEPLSETRLSPEQKSRIEEIKAAYTARLAEREIMFRSELNKLAGAVPPTEYHGKREELEARYRTDTASLREEMESRLAKLRGGDGE
ncbi:hypothetical protein JW905_11230 [bacterium]|nr:hypothetical protein [candidate division CSSED10-310 bacterium]